ncbi:PPC domain-containing DNA-binding protein [Methanobacterium sp.]|uniref:PPC domain-containing DNA-binding protein n=1 Tax=Methanobacterium sp. TaxID=2164 RepID=UPI002AB86FF8|nr:PPC domain-containing DNA-binding protein [Methanobacterium sp.]MDY9923807.1 PPC domain-containing DNA-binding protein [Methanobacterium sp.]
MIVKRLVPGQDLKKSLEEIRDNKGLKSGVILCLVGSLDEAVLRMADGNKKTINGPLEIVSATGTIATNGVHLHLAVADSQGNVRGGHLMRGCPVYTTVEICISCPDMVFKRVNDPETGYRELEIFPSST